MILYIVGILSLLLLYSVVTIIPWLNKRRAVSETFSKYYPLKPHWFWGHLKDLPGANEEEIKLGITWTESHPRCYAVAIGRFVSILDLNHPDTVKLLLKSDEPKSFAFGSAYGLLLPWIGKGLILSNGERWLRNRRLLTPAFHFDVLRPYVDVYNECTNALIEQFDKGSLNGISVDICEPVSLCTLAVILKCAFTYDKTEAIKEKADGNKFSYAKSVMTLTKLITDRVFEPLHYLDSIYYRTENGRRFNHHCGVSHKQATCVIEKRRQALENGKDPTSEKRYVDFLDILLLAKDQDGNGLTDAEIKDEVETFMFAGHDTTSSGISWILYNLANHPDIQEKAYQEVSQILGCGQQEVRWEHLPQFKYLTMCIKESLRLHPPVLVITRQTTKPLTINGDVFPKGTTVNINIYNTHHNPTVWGVDHMNYNPDRFLPDNITRMDPYAFVPFSAGPRNCIGQTFAMNEMKATVALVLNKFQMSVDDNHVIEMKPEITLKAKDGIKLHFQKRY